MYLGIQQTKTVSIWPPQRRNDKAHHGTMFQPTGAVMQSWPKLQDGQALSMMAKRCAKQGWLV